MASHAPKVVDTGATSASCMDANTTFVQADPATFRALVQRLTGAPCTTKPAAPASAEGQDVAAFVAHHQAPAPRRPKLQERRRGAPAARLELARAPLQPLYYYHHLMQYSPVSPMDAAYVMASASSSPSSPGSSSSTCGVVITREEEEREEKAIASKGFYLHSSPRSGGDGEKPRLLPLFPVHSPRSSSSFAWS